jgi:signal transduction histidine kinase
LIGKMPALGPTRPEDVIGELDRYLRPRLPRLGVAPDVQMRVRRGLPAIEANHVLLVWALENVVKNALDALAGRSGRIRVAALTGERDTVRFAVSDSGPGIDPAVRTHIFETGFSTKEGGWGVGLSLTRRIVEDLHGGRVTCRPRRGGGTVFEIDLPAATEPAKGPRVEWKT